MNEASNPKSRRRVAVVAHVGHAKSHLLRAIAIHKHLAENFDSVLIVPEKSRGFVQEYFPDLSCEWVRWLFSHNDVFDMRLSEVVRQLKMTVLDLQQIFERFDPELVIGVPGFQSSSICRTLGIPHIAALHGPWLVPEYVLSDSTAGEKAVLASWERAIELTDTLTNVIAHALGQKYDGYLDWLQNERVWIAQDFAVEYKNKRPIIGFLHTDFGPAAIKDLPLKCMSISLGTAIDDDKEKILEALTNEDLPKLIVGGAEIGDRAGVYWKSAIAGESLAKISSVALCHGGIGTIPVFANARVPQVFFPYDIDQAINAVLAHRSGFGIPINLDYWRRRTPFGRIRPEINTDEVRQLVRGAGERTAGRASTSNNKTAIESLVWDVIN